MKSILNYHDIDTSFSPFFSTISPKQFEKHLKFFKRNSIDLINFEEYFSRKNGIVITMDDGFKSLYRIIPPLMEEYNFKPIIFIVSGFIGGKSGWDLWINRKEHLNIKEIKYLSLEGAIFGSHTHNHPALTALTKEKIKFELEYSKKLIEDITGKDTKYISYPFGRFNRIVTEIAQEIGYSNGFVSVPIKFKKGDFNIGRWGVYLIDNLLSIKNKHNSGFFSNIEKTKCSLINKFSFLTYWVQHSYNVDK